MCGIAGFTGTGDRSVLERMTAAIAHRGPDADGHWVDESAAVFLGHRRLSIVDLAGGAQPMWTADGQVGVVFNGEIYNHQALRAELKGRGCVFETDHSDTEVLLHGYREWGEAFVERLNGMWAFVIYDRTRRRLFASRDRFGKKPLYYFHEGGAFGFASELSALRQHPACPANLSELSLQKYFAYCYVPAPRTIYERVWKLPGGHSCTYDLATRELMVWRYWRYELEPDEKLSALVRRPWRDDDPLIEEWCERLRATLSAAVERRLMSDVPLGVFLSGGIDSSAIAALAAAKVPKGALHTFAIGFDDATFDESAYARRMAGVIGSDHREEKLDLDKSVSLLTEIVSRLDEPLGDGSLLPTYLLSRFTRQHVTVALGGDGGDELFAGYDPFRALAASQRYARWIPRGVHAAARFMARLLPVSHANISLDFKIKRTLMGLSYPPALWNPVWMGAIEPRELARFFEHPAQIEEVYSEAIVAWERGGPQRSVVDRSLQFWTELYLQDGILAKVDRASMMCSLEARSPFLDIEVADLARRIPWQLKLHRGETKWILKRALEPILPTEIVHRKKKGFGMPIGRWLREGRFELPETAPHPSLRRDFAERQWWRHFSNRADERLFLWCYWLLGQWSSRACAS
jgi:asparagine synthase (glutamine-hydrolysing)